MIRIPLALLVATVMALPANAAQTVVELPTTPLTINGFRFNANTDEAMVVNGQLTVTAPANSATLTGHAFTASGQGLRNATVIVTSSTGATRSMGTTPSGAFISFLMRSSTCSRACSEPATKC